jgi:hypothetical protein
LRREAVEQAVAAGGDQVWLAAAARHVRGVPGPLIDGVGNALPIVVAEENPVGKVLFPDTGAARKSES